MKHERKAGILLPIASLPSTTGIGDFGTEAYKFVDLLAENKVKLWQILPLNPLGYGHSPYQPFSSFAIDEIYADLSELAGRGDFPFAGENFPFESYIHYEEVRAFKQKYLRSSFEVEIKKDPHCIDEFLKEHSWVASWGYFMMFKREYPNSWDTWPKEYQTFLSKKSKLPAEKENDYKYEIWLQMTLYRQWDKLHAYANSKGIQIIGDIPFYVGFDSVDVWANQEQFLLDPKSKQPTFIAGVPPDYFSATGQRWGNPIYDWDRMEKEDFAFIKGRIIENAKMYDIIRLDHFRAFDTFWKVPAECETAIDGEWIEAPGYKFFDSLFKEHPELKKAIIAEDLGDLRDEVLELRDHYDFPGMNVVEFTFHDAEVTKEQHDVWDAENAVVYLGTHDNDTMLSYFYNLPEDEQGEWVNALSNLGYSEGTIVSRLMKYCLNKKAKFVIFAMQDILELDTFARMNVPGIVDNINWTWKLADFSEFSRRVPELKKLIEESKR